MARYARVCTLSVDGTVVLPEAEPIEDLQTPCVVTKPAVPLRHSWCVPSFLFLQCYSTDVLLHRTIYIYHNANARVPYAPMTPSDSSYSVAYEVGLTTVGDFDAVVSYC